MHTLKVTYRLMLCVSLSALSDIDRHSCNLHVSQDSYMRLGPLQPTQDHREKEMNRNTFFFLIMNLQNVLFRLHIQNDIINLVYKRTYV